MALDPIVIGCDWQATLILEPTAGRTAADITSELGVGASVVARLVDSSGRVVATGAGSSITSASERTVEVVFSVSETSRVPPGVGHIIDVRLTTPAGKVRPIQVREKVEVRSFTLAVGR